MNEQSGYDATIQMPEGASTLAPVVDSLYYDIFWISVAFFVAIVGAMVWFAWRFRRRKGVKSKPPGHHTALELFWTFSPLILLAYMFHQGFDGFMQMSIAPNNAINIRAEARQWSWNFIYPSGSASSELTVPVNEPVRLIMSSHPRDERHPAVLHSLFIPAFRVKRDIVPGMYSSMWFEATRQGDYDLYCTEYCGLDQLVDEDGERRTISDEDLHADGRPTGAAGHSGMLSRVHVVTREEYDEATRIGIPSRFGGDYVAWGESEFTQCRACHVIQEGASATVGPNLYGVAGTMQPLEGGGERMADLAYLRESIMEPQAEIVRGFGGAAMPSFSSLPQIQIDAIIMYLASNSPAGDSVTAEAQAAIQEQE